MRAFRLSELGSTMSAYPFHHGFNRSIKERIDQTISEEFGELMRIQERYKNVLTTENCDVGVKRSNNKIIVFKFNSEYRQ